MVYIMYVCIVIKTKGMKKLIDLEGSIDKKGSIAYKLAVKAAESGKNLKHFIEEKLTDIANK